MLEKAQPVENKIPVPIDLPPENVDIEKLVELAIELKITVMHDLRRYFHDESFRASTFQHGQLKLHADTFRSVLPIILNGASIASQAFATTLRVAAPFAEKIQALRTTRFSSDLLKSYADATGIADSLFRSFKEMNDNSLAARRAEINHESARSLADFITQHYKKLQQDEADAHREQAQHESRKNDFDIGLTR